MVEIEIGVLRGRCLDRRINDKDRLIREIDAWEQQRNAEGARIKWMFTTELDFIEKYGLSSYDAAAGTLIRCR